ncbi:MAG: PQQ-binding-like beta-propeller repeat protein [Limisphaerales bacterium]
MKKKSFLLILSALIPCFMKADWPQFRGPDGQGHSKSKNVPLEWSDEKNVKWKMAVPGKGFSSPVIFNQQIWMTSAENEGKSLHAICLDKTSGKLIHNIKVITTDDAGPRHRLNGYASPTPVIDKEHVFVHFGPRGTACLNKKGEVIWKNTDLNYNVIQGGASSPILYNDVLFLTCDGIDFQFLVALEKQTGKVKWKQDRAHLEAAAQKRAIAKMSYSTPLIQSVEGITQLVCSGADHVASYNINDGKEIWWMPYNGFSIVGRPSYGNSLFYVVGSIRQDHFCIYAVQPGKGQLKNNQIKWQYSKGVPHVSSPILVDTEVYFVHDGGVASCLNAITGELIWNERLGGNYDASPIRIQNRLYFLNREGKTTVLSTGKRFNKLATNQLKGTFKASPAVADGSLFLRSDTHLFRIEKNIN